MGTFHCWRGTRGCGIKGPGLWGHSGFIQPLPWYKGISPIKKRGLVFWKARFVVSQKSSFPTALVGSRKKWRFNFCVLWVALLVVLKANQKENQHMHVSWGEAFQETQRDGPTRGNKQNKVSSIKPILVRGAWGNPVNRHTQGNLEDPCHIASDGTGVFFE